MWQKCQSQCMKMKLYCFAPRQVSLNVLQYFVVIVEVTLCYLFLCNGKRLKSLEKFYLSMYFCKTSITRYFISEWKQRNIVILGMESFGMLPIDDANHRGECWPFWGLWMSLVHCCSWTGIETNLSMRTILGMGNGEQKLLGWWLSLVYQVFLLSSLCQFTNLLPYFSVGYNPIDTL